MLGGASECTTAPEGAELPGKRVSNATKDTKEAVRAAMLQGEMDVLSQRREGNILVAS